LSRHDPRRASDRLREKQQKGRKTLGRLAARASDRLESEHDQRVTRQHRERLAELLVNRGLAAPDLGGVEAGEIVMHERGAVQELDRRSGRISRHREAVAARHGDGQTEPRPDPGAAWKHGIAKRSRKLRGTFRPARPRNGILQGLLDSVGGLHRDPPGVKQTCQFCDIV
jgi:hypothetical protein